MRVPVFGTGAECIYMYSFPSTPQFLKIGRSSRADAWRGRISDQVGTANPEHPVVRAVVRTDDSLDLEFRVHNELKARGRWLVDAPGREWFRCTVAEAVAAAGHDPRGMDHEVYRSNGRGRLPRGAAAAGDLERCRKLERRVRRWRRFSAVLFLALAVMAAVQAL
jgi:hypothetical protein